MIDKRAIFPTIVRVVTEGQPISRLNQQDADLIQPDVVYQRLLGTPNLQPDPELRLTLLSPSKIRERRRLTWQKSQPYASTQGQLPLIGSRCVSAHRIAESGCDDFQEIESTAGGTEVR